MSQTVVERTAEHIADSVQQRLVQLAQSLTQ